MKIEIKVPVLPESVSEATVATWHKQVGDSVSVDENIVDIETEKVVLEVPSTVDGVLTEILEEEGATVGEQAIIAIVEEGAASTNNVKAGDANSNTDEVATVDDQSDADVVSPAIRRLVIEKEVDIKQITGTGKNGRILKEDVLNFVKNKTVTAPAVAPTPVKPVVSAGERVERREPMSRLRSTIARCLFSLKLQ